MLSTGSPTLSPVIAQDGPAARAGGAVFDGIQDAVVGRRSTPAAASGDAPPHEDGAALEWSEAAIVQLHWALLRSASALADPATPLWEKIETLRWVFTSPDRDRRPFSFANCVRVVGTSPLSPTAYFGLVDVEAIRDWMRPQVVPWLREAIAKYPPWVQALVLDNPDYVERRLDANPQWLNEQVKRRATQGLQPDLFAESRLDG